MRILEIPLLTALVLLSACATVAPSASSPGSGKVDEGALNALYAELGRDSQRFEAGLAQGRSGDLDAAHSETKAALDALQANAVRCTTLPGCDGSRFASTYDRLLRLGVQVPVAPGAAESDTAVEDALPEEAQGSPVIASVPAMERTITLLKGRELSEILLINDPVKAALEQWLTQYRPSLMTAYVNYEFMRYRMWPEYHKAGLPEALLFGMLAKESGGRVHAVSRAGASGPLQFMYATGLRFGLGNKDGFDQRFDPGLSARANAAYINEQLAVFNGNLELVIAAYNGGEGRMRRLAARGGATSFWDPGIYSVLPDETRDYVPMVLAAAWLFLHPERYNLEFPKIDRRPGSITLSQPISLTELAGCFGNSGGNYDGWFRTLRNLNPAFDPQQQLPVSTRLEVPKVLEQRFAIACGQGQWVELAQELNAATRAARPSRSTPNRGVAKTYTVKRGDNMASIVRHNGCRNVREIADLNGIRAPQYRIRAGQQLRLANCSR